MQAGQDIRFVEQRFPGMRRRAVAARFMEDRTIALFELALRDGDIRVLEERRYRLVPADRLDAGAIRHHRDR